MNSLCAMSRQAEVASLALTGLLALLLGMPALADGRLSRADEYAAGVAHAEAARVAEQSACTPLPGTPRDVCRERAHGKAAVAAAELEFARTGTHRSEGRLAIARMDSAYALARTTCNEHLGEAKVACARQAHADRVKALAAWHHHQRMTVARAGAHGTACAGHHSEMHDNCLAAAPPVPVQPASR